MKSRLFWGLIIVLVIITISAGYKIYSSSQEAQEKTMSKLHFGKWKANIVFTDTQNEKALNLFLVEEVAKKGSESKLDDLVSVSFNGTENVWIESFDIKKGKKLEDQSHLINLTVNLQAKTFLATETLSEITLFYQNSEPEIYDIGDILIMTVPEQELGDISDEDGPAAYSSHVYRGTFKNNTEEELQIINLTDLNEESVFKNIKIDGLSLESKAVVIGANESFFVEAALDEAVVAEYQFMHITPIMHYTKADEKYEQYLTEALYGITDIDAKTVEIIRKK